MKKLLKILLPILAAVIVIVGAVLIVKAVNRPKTADYELRTASAAIAPLSVEASNEELTDYTHEILAAIANRDYAALSSIVHGDFGVVFSPDATVDLTADLCFTASQIADFATDSEKYMWGVHSVSGETIELTP